MSKEYFKCPWCNNRNYVHVDDIEQDDNRGSFVLNMTCTACNKKIGVSGDYELTFEIDDYQKVCSKCDEEIDEDGEDKGCIECGRCINCCTCIEDTK